MKVWPPRPTFRSGMDDSLAAAMAYSLPTLLAAPTCLAIAGTWPGGPASRKVPLSMMAFAAVETTGVLLRDMESRLTRQ